MDVREVSGHVSIDQQMAGIIETDKTRNIMLIGQKIADCIKQYHLSLQQIESCLREKKCFTYLIARKRNESQGDNLLIELPTGTAKTYFLVLSTCDREITEKELRLESKTYQENFEKLADTGMMVLRKDKPLLSQFRSGDLTCTSPHFERLLSELSMNKSHGNH